MADDIVNLAQVRKALKAATRKPRRKRRERDPIQDYGLSLAFECLTLWLRAARLDRMDIRLLSDAARAIVRDRGEMDFLVHNPRDMLNQADAAIALLARWRAAVHVAITEVDADDPPGGAA